MLDSLRDIIDVAINQIFPLQCVACNVYGSALCPSCAQTVDPMPPTICLTCGRPEIRQIATCFSCHQLEMALGEPPLLFSRSATLFTSPIREAVHGLKYEKRTELAEPLARYLFAVFQGYPWSDLYMLIDAVVPVPLHPQRLEERGYNQAELLAEQFCNYVKLPCMPTLLQRSHHTESQVGKNIAQRQQNVGNAFQATVSLHGLTVLLVDDVYTTGSTLQACAIALKNAGVAQVYALALATPKM